MSSYVIWELSDESKAMKTRQLGDITINRILELEAPYARPLEFFDEPGRSCKYLRSYGR